MSVQLTPKEDIWGRASHVGKGMHLELEPWQP